MDLIDAILLGAIEGITEFLPISSTGHLILASRGLGVDQTEFLKSFEISIQLGAILAVFSLYWKSFLLNLEILKRVGLAFLPTAILGLIFYKLVKQYLLENAMVVLIALVLGGILIILFEKKHREKDGAVGNLESITAKQSILIGVCQAAAIIPGVSRSAATILGGLLLGLKRQTIVEFSFLVAVPTMLAATGLDLLKTGPTFSMEQVNILVAGFIVAFIVAILAVKFLLKFIKSHNFTAFGVYRIIIAIVFWAIIF